MYRNFIAKSGKFKKVIITVGKMKAKGVMGSIFISSQKLKHVALKIDLCVEMGPTSKYFNLKCSRLR